MQIPGEQLGELGHGPNRPAWQKCVLVCSRHNYTSNELQIKDDSYMLLSLKAQGSLVLGRV